MFLEIEKLLRKVGDELLKWRGSSVTQGELRGSQLKTEADRRAHQILANGLNQLNPDIPIISEEDETGQLLMRPDVYWLIDPIDGTASYSEGFTGFVTQLALMKKNEPIIAGIYGPALNSLYMAEKGKGGTLNGKNIQRFSRDSRKLLIDNYPEPRGIAKEVFETMECSGYVESGSLGLKLARIADGTADIFVKDVKVKDWDLAPADLLIREVGAELCSLNGEKLNYSGSYEKIGFVGACDSILVEEIRVWYEKHLRR